MTLLPCGCQVEGERYADGSEILRLSYGPKCPWRQDPKNKQPLSHRRLP